jgi:hypothetical protein
MAEQIRLTLTVDAGVKKLIEESAHKYANDNVSAYVRGLVVFHALLDGRSTGHADIPGWLLAENPLACIEYMREARKHWFTELEHAVEETAKRFEKEFGKHLSKQLSKPVNK